MTYHNAHAARIDDANIVQEVIVIPYSNDDDAEITAYCNSIGLPGTWIDCSYLGSRRGRYPGAGFRYDEATDEFVTPGWEWVNGSWIPPQPFPSWTFDGSDWIPPIPYPNDDLGYLWDESNQQWKPLTV